MALARLALRNLQQRVLSTGGSLQKQCNRLSNNNELVARFSTAVGDKGKSEGSEVAISEDKKSRLFPRRRGRRWLSRDYDRDFLPAPFGTFLPLAIFFILINRSIFKENNTDNSELG
jgi:HSP20 family protein